MRQFLAAAGLAALGAACASSPETISLAAADPAQLQKDALVTVEEDAPQFVPVTAGGAMWGALSGAVIAAKADGYKEKHGLEDPAPMVEAALADYLASRRRMALSPRPISFAGADKPDALAGPADALIVDVDTDGWGYRYLGMKFDRFTVDYRATARVIDGASGAVVAQHQCALSSHPKGDGAPSHDELIENDAAGLKAILADLAGQCAEDVKTAALAGL